ncbi:MAG: hypothetical protein PCFJNLEI_04222 [Verrucomicrobiae bacterium]|nr:hypothetical protein [Verrucomicrobiae bacterium]
MEDAPGMLAQPMLSVLTLTVLEPETRNWLPQAMGAPLPPKPEPPIVTPALLLRMPPSVTLKKLLAA